MKQVIINISNYSKCLCPVCPVQASSGCIAAKREGWLATRLRVGKILEEYPDHPEAFEMEMSEVEKSEVGKKHEFIRPEHDEMEELYCSAAVGESECGDLNDDAICQCPTCAVWSNHELRSAYYCMRSPE